MGLQGSRTGNGIDLLLWFRARGVLRVWRFRGLRKLSRNSFRPWPLQLSLGLIHQDLRCSGLVLSGLRTLSGLSIIQNHSEIGEYVQGMTQRVSTFD